MSSCSAVGSILVAPLLLEVRIPIVDISAQLQINLDLNRSKQSLSNELLRGVVLNLCEELAEHGVEAHLLDDDQDDVLESLTQQARQTLQEWKKKLKQAEAVRDGATQRINEMRTACLKEVTQLRDQLRHSGHRNTVSLCSANSFSVPADWELDGSDDSVQAKQLTQQQLVEEIEKERHRARLKTRRLSNAIEGRNIKIEDLEFEVDRFRRLHEEGRNNDLDNLESEEEPVDLPPHPELQGQQHLPGAVCHGEVTPQLAQETHMSNQAVQCGLSTEYSNSQGVQSTPQSENVACQSACPQVTDRETQTESSKDLDEVENPTYVVNHSTEDRAGSIGISGNWAHRLVPDCNLEASLNDSSSSGNLHLHKLDGDLRQVSQISHSPECSGDEDLSEEFRSTGASALARRRSLGMASLSSSIKAMMQKQTAQQESDSNQQSARRPLPLIIQTVQGGSPQQSRSPSPPVDVSHESVFQRNSFPHVPRPPSQDFQRSFGPPPHRRNKSRSPPSSRMSSKMKTPQPSLSVVGSSSNAGSENPEKS